jgi:predicted nucleotidyltransferase
MDDTAWRAFRSRCKADPDVVGLILTGSRGRGSFAREDSDWDVRVVLRDEVDDQTLAGWELPHGSTIEGFAVRLAHFATVAMPGTPSVWDRYSYVRATLVLDKLDGEVERLLAAKATRPAEEARPAAELALDDYINSYARSRKNARAGLRVAAHLDATESLPHLLDFLFAMHARVRPFNRFLDFELRQEPFPELGWDVDTLLPRLEALATEPTLERQAALFRDVESLARAHGFDAVVDGWEPDVESFRRSS